MLRALHLAFALLCGAAMSQFPEFYQQYQQRLGGSLDEVTMQIAALDARAEEAGMDRYDYVRHFQTNSDAVIQREGDAMLDTVARHRWLTDSLERMRQAPWYMIIIETLFHLDREALTNTLENFVPAVPLSVSGGAHAFLGFFFGFLGPSAIRSLFPKRRPAPT